MDLTNLDPQLVQAIGAIGNVLLVAAYIPQIAKILKTKKAEDISTLMWLAYFVGDIFLLFYSIVTNEPIFVMLFTLFTIGNIVLFVLSIKYNKPRKTDEKVNDEPTDSDTETHPSNEQE